MGKHDLGYTKVSTSVNRGSYSSRGGGGGRSRSRDTVLAQTRKDELVDAYVRVAQDGILDVLNLGDNADMAMSIRKKAEADLKGMTKSEVMDALETAKRESSNNYYGYAAEAEVREFKAAQAILEALQVASKPKERADLDDGDLLDDPVNLIVDGQGWGEESQAKLEMRKHVNIAVDNSGSTHTAETGYCQQALISVAKNIMRVLHTVGKQYPYITYDVFSFNRIAHQHTGPDWRGERAELAYKQLKNLYSADPLKRDATYTFLAPLLESIYENEVRRNKINEPRIDIILTDGEFESKRDMKAAKIIQSKRGTNVSTYVLNMWPENEDEDIIPLPNEFRVVPVHCLGKDSRTEIVLEKLKNTKGSTIDDNGYYSRPLKKGDPLIGTPVPHYDMEPNGLEWSWDRKELYEIGYVTTGQISLHKKEVNERILRTTLNQIVYEEMRKLGQ